MAGLRRVLVAVAGASVVIWCRAFTTATFGAAHPAPS